MTFHDWMAAALYDADEGYYSSNRIRWGREGDYRTSPERSALFAATFASYFAKLHGQLGSPEQWTIVEVGAGDGRFAERALQTLAECYPQVFAQTSYVIDEISPHSRTLAAERLRRFQERWEFAKLEDMRPFIGIVFSNELLDAFPVHRFIIRDGRLCEFYVEVGAAGEFKWRLDEPAAKVAGEAEKYLRSDETQLSEGQVFEVSFKIADWLESCAAKLQQGYVVTVDYGAGDPDTSRRSTLRGFERHRFVEDLLRSPGRHDLTTSVDWSFVMAAGKDFGLGVVDFEQLDKFLLDAGLLQQLELQLKQTHSEAERLCLSTSAREMILPGGMAASFQVLVQGKH